jgi:hypothetical protein
MRSFLQANDGRHNNNNHGKYVRKDYYKSSRIISQTFTKLWFCESCGIQDRESTINFSIHIWLTSCPSQIRSFSSRQYTTYGYERWLQFKRLTSMITCLDRFLTSVTVTFCSASSSGSLLPKKTHSIFYSFIPF